MGNPISFHNIVEYDVFQITFLCLVLMESIIWFMTSSPFRKEKAKKSSDHGSMILIMAGFYICIYISIKAVSQDMVAAIRNLVLPAFLSYIGIGVVWIGIVVRIMAVLKLKKAFTYNVQVADEQNLITDGLYHIVRNPAYTGSVISLIGIALAFRNIVAIILVIGICRFCYGKRIQIEEKALKNEFTNEFIAYCNRTKYRVIPFIW
ncbi:putative protein-S-isoprenylcysteine methyltransferase [Lachnospiraceae bacterium KM106-2]|nr:putative protein-S-isoprenylcysteine methyltransferase [Lachnospiraceae bacterium KM106-2]